MAPADAAHCSLSSKTRRYDRRTPSGPGRYGAVTPGKPGEVWARDSSAVAVSTGADDFWL